MSIGAALLPMIALLMIIPSAYAAPGDLCYEQADDMCGLASGNPAEMFGAILTPLNIQTQNPAIDNVGMIVLWGGIMGVIWFKTENIMLLGIVGLVIASTFTIAFPEEAIGVGYLLLAVSIGILLFQLIRQKVSIFS